MIWLLSLLLALPVMAQEYPPILIDVLGYDVLHHHYKKDEVPVFSVLGGGKRSLLTCQMVEVPDTTHRATVDVGGSRRTVRVDGTATRVYDMRGEPRRLDSLVKGGRYILAYYDAAEPVVTEIVSLDGSAELGGAFQGKPRTLPVEIGGVRLHPPQGWQAGGFGDLVPRVYRGKLRPHLFVRRLEGGLEGAWTGVAEVASVDSERLALWTFEDKVLVVRMRVCGDGVVVALCCLLEDYRGLVPGFLEMVGNLGTGP